MKHCIAEAASQNVLKVLTPHGHQQGGLRAVGVSGGLLLDRSEALPDSRSVRNATPWTTPWSAHFSFYTKTLPEMEASRFSLMLSRMESSIVPSQALVPRSPVSLCLGPSGVRPFRRKRTEAWLICRLLTACATRCRMPRPDWIRKW